MNVVIIPSFDHVTRSRNRSDRTAVVPSPHGV